MKNIVILGSTGSIGESTLRVVRALPHRLNIVGLAVNRDYKAAIRQALEFGVRHVAVADATMAAACRAEAPVGIRVYAGEEGVSDVAALADADVVVCAIVGMAGLLPVLSAIHAGKDIALATKEVLVSAGKVVVQAAARSGSRLLPVDSEHSAIFQCLGRDAFSPVCRESIGRLILTASGGPFGDRSDVDFDRVTVEEALSHPRWDMGSKISVDSATLMNKGLEVIEGHWLFDIPLDRISVVVHPQSIIHSMVEFVDGSILSQMSLPDMRFAIQYALTYPDRAPSGLPLLNLSEIRSLTFREPDEKRFPCLALARQAGETGGTMPAVLNAANEVAVEKFLARSVPFSGIWRLVSHVMSRHNAQSAETLDQVQQADIWARKATQEAADQGVGDN